MVTVMTWGNSEGTKDRCDAKCHEAIDPDCDCMCGGRYHGANRTPSGLEARMKVFEDEVLEKARARAAAGGVDLEVRSVAELFGQGRLF